MILMPVITAQRTFMPPFLPQSPLCSHRITRPEVQDFLNIVNQAVEHPLNIDFDPPSKRKSIEPLLRSNIAEYRLHDPQPFTVGTAALHRVDLLLHLIRDACRTFPIKYMYLPRDRVGLAQTFTA